MKKMVVAAMIAAFVMSSTIVMAAKVKCTVDSVDDDKVVMTCKKADKLKAGSKVVVKEKKKAAYEGC